MASIITTAAIIIRDINKIDTYIWDASEVISFIEQKVRTNLLCKDMKEDTFVSFVRQP